MVDVGAIGQEYIGNGASILVETVSQEGDYFPEGEIRGGLLGFLTVGLAFLWAVVPLMRMRCRIGCAAAC